MRSRTPSSMLKQASALVLFAIAAASLLHCALAARVNSVQLLYQNDGDWVRAYDDAQRQAGFLLVDTPFKATEAGHACAGYNEALYAPRNADSIDAGLAIQLAYLVETGQYAPGQSFWIDNVMTKSSSTSHATLVIGKGGKLTISMSKTGAANTLPVLCTQSAPRRYANMTDFDANWRVQTGHWLGFRDAFSFRFLNVPCASLTQRFTPSKVLESDTIVNATAGDRSLQCPQTAGTDYGYTEQCLVMNIYTPALSTMPSATSSKAESTPARQRPVMLWLHGGGLTSGSGLDETFDGGSLASRGDVVVVTPNYRLGTLGFLAVGDEPGSANFGFGDVITALKWVQKYIHYFGGDASQVTVFGQSAGAQLVSALLGSKAAQGLFHRAIVQSGRPSDTANTLPTVQASLGSGGNSAQVITALGCSPNGTAADLLTCLRALPADKFLTTNPKASTLLVDGKTITQGRLRFSKDSQNYFQPGVPLMQGFMRDELGSLGSGIPNANETNLDAGLKSAGVTDGNRTTIEANPTLFPTDGPGGVQNTTVSVVTDITSIARCGQEATLYAAAQSGATSGVYGYYQNQRSIQIPNFDPFGICQQQQLGQPYYLCHSGDLLPVFGTPGYAFKLAPRDEWDIPYVNLLMDHWTAFARTGNPNPSKAFLEAHNYTTTQELLQGKKWKQVSDDTANGLWSLGPSPGMVELDQRGEQCTTLGYPLNYVTKL